jgi:adenosine deaminase
MPHTCNRLLATAFADHGSNKVIMVVIMRDLRLLPKAHLHTHVESAIRASTLRELGADVGPSVFDGFGAFAAHNGLVRDCLRRPADFARIGREFCVDEAADGTRYAEVTFTAAGHGERLGDLDMPLAALLDGLAAGQAETGIEVRVLLDHPRRRSVQRAWRTLELAVRHKAVGIGLAGAEGYPVEPFAEVFAAAEDAGIRLVHHAGEECGPASIRAAIGVGRADRIGHGIRAVEDSDLMAELRDRAIPLEVCPSSNVALGLVASMAAHPLPRLVKAGLVVTVNADIPASIRTSLTQEFIRIRDTFGYDDVQLAELARAGVDASFASDTTKAHLKADIDAWLASASS